MSGMSSFTSRFLTGPEYVFALHEPSDQVAVLARNRTRHQTTQRILPAEAIASVPFQSWLHEQNRSGGDIFIGMNPVREGSRNRTKEQIREVRHAYLDLDEEAGASLQAIRTSGDVPPPNFVLDTSPGKHQVVWRVEGLDTRGGNALACSCLAVWWRSGSDRHIPASSLARIQEPKYNDAFLIRVHRETDAVYHQQDFHIHKDSPESPKDATESLGGTRRMPTGHRSQSEADWAYAKRALARGDDPEIIIQRIADYRADEKSDPIYYARHTVTKAQAELVRQSPTGRSSEGPGTAERESSLNH